MSAAERIAARDRALGLAREALFGLRVASASAMNEDFNAPIVADIIERAVAEERDACANIADAEALHPDAARCSIVAERIRARGK